MKKYTFAFIVVAMLTFLAGVIFHSIFHDPDFSESRINLWVSDGEGGGYTLTLADLPEEVWDLDPAEVLTLWQLVLANEQDEQWRLALEYHRMKVEHDSKSEDLKMQIWRFEKAIERIDKYQGTR